MKVTMIDYTGRGCEDAWDAARKLILVKNTRVAKGVDMAAKVQAMAEPELIAELNYIANTIRSSWEFVVYTFKVEGISRACCDQMTRTRTASFAVMAQRVVDQSDFAYVMPKTLSGHSLGAAVERHMKMTAGLYKQLVDAGIPTQDARSILPMATESPLTVQYNLRTLADLVGKRDNLRAQGEYVDVMQEMARQVIARHPWVKPFLYPERKDTPALTKVLKGVLGDATPSGEIADALKEVDRLKGTWG